MAINNFNVTYPDFQLGGIIQPDEIDVNFSDLTIRCNQLIDVVNQVTDGMGGSGASTINLSAIAPFASTELQVFLQEVVDRLQSGVDGSSGADFVVSTSIAGVTGSTVQAQLESLKALLDNVQAQIHANDTDINNLRSKDTDLQTQITSNDTDIDSAKQRLTKNESDIASLKDKDTQLQAQITSNDTDITNVKARVSTNETDISGLKSKDVNLQSQIDALNNTYSTDAERIQAINDVINQFEIADGDLEVLINNKANKSDVYTRNELYTNTEIEGLVKFNQAVDAETGVVTGREVFTIVHNMNDFPSVHVIGEKGYGHYGYAEGSYGIASDKFRLPCRVDYPDANKLIVSIDEHYEGTPSVTLNGNVATVTFSDEQVTLSVYLRGNN